MFCPICRLPMLRRLRAALSRLLPLAVLLALGACDGGDSPLAPADTSPVPAEGEALVPNDQPASPELALATTAQRILFSSARTGGYDLFKMDPQGYNVVRLTTFASTEGEPAWSYDNKRIAMIRRRLDASNVKHWDIYLMNADGTNKHWARSAPSSFNILNPSWSPDGSHLLVTVWWGGMPYLAKLQLATGELAYVQLGPKLVKGTLPSYDKTGTKIIYLSVSGTTIDMVSPAAGTNIRLVSSSTPLSSPRVSPDGTKIAYGQLVGTNVDIYVRAFPNGTPKRLTSHAAYDGLPTWSPDGSKIAFESARSGISQIWTMNAATGGSLTRITHTTTYETWPAWSH